MDRVFSQTFGVVGAILEKNGKVLLVKELGTADKGKWNQPAGWIDIGEDLVSAAIREVSEETGMDFKPTHLLGVYTLVRKDLENKLGAIPHALKFIFVGEFAENGSRAISEIGEIGWFAPEEIYAMGPDVLRDLDIKKEVKDYFDGKKFPLEIINFTISK